MEQVFKLVFSFIYLTKRRGKFPRLFVNQFSPSDNSCIDGVCYIECSTVFDTENEAYFMT